MLRVLWEHQDIAFHQLADITLIPAPSLVGVVDRLSHSGLVERRRSDSDRRKVSVLATRKGKALERKVRPRVEEAYAELRSAINKKEWNQLIDGLDRLALVKLDDGHDKRNDRHAQKTEG